MEQMHSYIHKTAYSVSERLFTLLYPAQNFIYHSALALINQCARCTGDCSVLTAYCTLDYRFKVKTVLLNSIKSTEWNTIDFS